MLSLRYLQINYCLTPPIRPIVGRQYNNNAFILFYRHELLSAFDGLFCISATGVSIAQAYGATSVRANLDELRRGCDIIVATPGRLFDFIARGSVSLPFLAVDLIFKEISSWV